MKLPRDISAKRLIKILSKHGYQITRQRGSHIRLTKISETETHHITVPNHSSVSIGTLVKIIDDACLHLGISREEFLS